MMSTTAVSEIESPHEDEDVLDFLRIIFLHTIHNEK